MIISSDYYGQLIEKMLIFSAASTNESDPTPRPASEVVRGRSSRRMTTTTLKTTTRRSLDRSTLRTFEKTTSGTPSTPAKERTRSSIDDEDDTSSTETETGFCTSLRETPPKWRKWKRPRKLFK